MSTGRGRVATLTTRAATAALAACLLTAGPAGASPRSTPDAGETVRALEAARGMDAAASSTGLVAPVVDAPAVAEAGVPVRITWTPVAGADVWFYVVHVDGRLVRYVDASTRSVTLPFRPGTAEVVVTATALVDDGDGQVVVRAESAPASVEVTGPPPRLFTDVGSSHPFYVEVFWLGQAGITTGYPDGTFRPTDQVKRQSMAAFLHRFVGGHLDGFVPPARPTFRDVPRSHPFFEEIEWLVWAGVASGYPDGTFRPDRTISRQAMAAFIWRLSAVYLGDDEAWEYEPRGYPPFVDVDWSDPFAVEIAWLVDRGMVTGYPDGTYLPSRSVSRQAMAAFLERFALI